MSATLTRDDLLKSLGAWAIYRSASTQSAESDLAACRNFLVLCDDVGQPRCLVPLRRLIAWHNGYAFQEKDKNRPTSLPALEKPLDLLGLAQVDMSDPRFRKVFEFWRETCNPSFKGDGSSQASRHKRTFWFVPAAWADPPDE